MKELIYSQEDLDLILSLETEEKDKEIERLKQEKEKLENIIIETNSEKEKLFNHLINDKPQQRNEKAIEYIKKNCILSDTWEDLDFCNFVPIGKIKYKFLSNKKVKELLDILKGVDKE